MQHLHMAKSKIGLLMVGILAFIGYKYYENINNFIETVTVKVHKMNIDLLASLGTGLKFIILPSIFTISNTSNLNAKVNSIMLDFYYNNKLIGTVGGNKEIVIQAGSSSFVETTVKLTTAEIVKIIPSVKEFLNGQRTFVIKGVLKTNIGNVKINESVTV